MPAIGKWFIHVPSEEKSAIETMTDGRHVRTSLNRDHFLRFGSTHVPLEISNKGRFSRIESTLSFFLECVHAAASTAVIAPSRYFTSYLPGARSIRRTTKSNQFFSTKKPAARVYLAQAPIADLPQALRDDLPTPEIVRRAGRGDVYDAAVWLGEAPTYTPLHRDPNPNLFVQLAGEKMVRLMTPEMGHAAFAKVQDDIGGDASAHMRGEEMMQGAEKIALEKAVWSSESDLTAVMWQARLRSGDALYIPKGWWHSVKGVGHGMTGSANWWFR